MERTWWNEAAAGLTGDDLWQATVDTQEVAACCQAFTPRAKPLILPWACENIVNADGRPYDHSAYPHLGAPGGPMDAWDNPDIREISLQFGSRLGKTFFGQCGTLWTADNDPAPMMHANGTQDLALGVLDRTYKMIRARHELRRHLAFQNQNDQKQDLIEFIGCNLFSAWSRSVATLADKDVKVGHGGEVDKWEMSSTSKEGDPQKLFFDRFKNHWSVRKIICESTPTRKYFSRIETRLLAGSNCRLQVPCPKCQRYQQLEMGGKKTAHGLKWQHPERGHCSPAQAKKTAHYVCRHCHAQLDDHSRAWMIRRGVWVPEACSVDDQAALAAAEQRLQPGKLTEDDRWRGWKSSPWIRGNPVRDGEHQSYQLSSLYALSLAWGDIAAEFVDCCEKPQLLKNFVNGWLAETWEPRKGKSSPDKIVERIGTTRQDSLVPVWGRLLTVTVDRQAADGGFVKYVVQAHGEGDRSAVIHHGVTEQLEWVWEHVMRREYLHEDGGRKLNPHFSGVDSGWNTKATYEFCNAHPGVIAIKGSDSDLGGQAYQLVTLGDGGKKTRTGAVGQPLLHVNTDFWEEDLQHRLDERLANETGSLALSAAAAGDEEFVAELLNGVLTDAIDKRGNARLLWVKKIEAAPNDYRDAIRYGLCLAKAWLDANGNVFPARGPAAEPNPAAEKPAHVRPTSESWIRRR